MTTPTIPNVTGLTNLQAAIQYAKHGIYVLPIKPGTKHPGSIVGKNWQQKSSRDPQQIADWFLEHPEAGVAIHAGRSGLVILDIDTPQNTPPLLVEALTNTPAPYQTTRRNDPARRHYIYKQPAGKRLGNGLGALPKGWGDIRGEGGIILVEPSPHPSEDGQYKWGTTGEIPELPASIAEKLTTHAGKPVDPATDQTILDFITKHTTPGDTNHADAWVATYQRRLRDGDSRHNAMVAILTGALKEAKAGYYPAAYVETRLREAFLNSFATPPDTAKPGVNHRPLTPQQAASEWVGILAWAVAQAGNTNTAEIIERAETHAPTLGTGLVERLATPQGGQETGRTEQDEEQSEQAEAEAEVEPQTPLGALLNGNTAAVVPPAQQDDAKPTWEPLDLTSILTGESEPAKPTLGERTDGKALFYPGLVHSVYGESESGKSWLAQHTAVTLLDQEKRVAYIDFESDPHSITNRLKQLGATNEQLSNQDFFKYIRPEASPTAFNETNAFTALCFTSLDLIIIDGVTEALTLQSKKSLDNDDITMWMRQIPKQLAKHTGAAVILIDHVIKASEGRGRFPIGGQAKMAAIDGAAYYVEPLTALGAGLDGTLTIRVTKDRPGQVRAHAGAWSKKDRTQEAARFRIDSTNEQGTRTWIEPPEYGEINETKEFIPTRLMESISKVLNNMREPISFNQLHELLKEKGSGAKKTTIMDAVARLVDGGFVIEKDGARGARLLRSTGTYLARNDPNTDEYAGDVERYATQQAVDVESDYGPF